MKKCTSCVKEIEDTAKKCPCCQAFQSWFRNPQFYGMFFPLIFIPIMFYSFGIFGSPQFADHKTDISTIFISDKVVDNEKIINYRIDNKSDVTWNDVSFNVTGYDKDGSLVMSKSEHEYKWFLAARGSNVLTVKVSKDPQIVKWTLEISSLVKNRF